MDSISTPTPAPTPPPAPMMGPAGGSVVGGPVVPSGPVTKMPKRGKGWVWPVMLVLSAGLVGGGVWWWQNQMLDASKTEVSDLTDAKKVLTDKVAGLTAKNDELAATSSKPEADKDVVAKVAKAKCEAQVGYTATLGTVTFNATDANFARVDVTCKKGTAAATALTNTLKKTGGTWVVVFESAKQPAKADGEKYGMPKDWYAS